MKLITKEGKLFGKVNIIDLMIVVFIIAFVGLGVMKLTEGKGPVFVNNTKEYEFDILLRSIYDTFPEKINIGDKYYDQNSGVYLGEVIEKTVEPAYRDVEAADGSIVKSAVPDRWDVVITLKGNGNYNVNKGLSVGGEMRYIGLVFRMKSPLFIIDGVIIDMRIEE